MFVRNEREGGAGQGCVGGPGTVTQLALGSVFLGAFSGDKTVVWLKTQNKK